MEKGYLNIKYYTGIKYPLVLFNFQVDITLFSDTVWYSILNCTFIYLVSTLLLTKQANEAKNRVLLTINAYFFTIYVFSYDVCFYKSNTFSLVIVWIVAF